MSKTKRRRRSKERAQVAETIKQKLQRVFSVIPDQELFKRCIEIILDAFAGKDAVKSTPGWLEEMELNGSVNPLKMGCAAVDEYLAGLDISSELHASTKLRAIEFGVLAETIIHFESEGGLGTDPTKVFDALGNLMRVAPVDVTEHSIEGINMATLDRSMPEHRAFLVAVQDYLEPGNLRLADLVVQGRLPLRLFK